MPKEVKDMIHAAIEGKFQLARENLDRLIIAYGLSGEDILYQIYREIGKMEMPEKQRMKLIEIVGEYNFRLIEGANERIQLEALLAQFAKGLE
jgi:replication factor C small subunit